MNTDTMNVPEHSAVDKHPPAPTPAQNGHSGQSRSEPCPERALSDAHLEQLRGSGLSDDQIKLSGFFTTDDATAIGKALRWAKPAAAAALGSCLAIPYRNSAGECLTDYARF